MIINNAPAHEAVLSNVGEIGEFRIRNSAKAFNILSSGLYANKIRAVIRELSCNAVDSHTAAGKSDVPFDVRLPTQLDPTFAIRDYGTGLTHDQVTNIYTTYFESTKTESNAFIGALGLGSKSPFSYTDNFTVTAIKDGRKGIYSAFINGEGVPSIALMAEEATTDPAGVEIKFAVNERYDFEKFRSEAQTVYRYFSLRPVVSGPDFEFRDVEYESRDIVPGVHSYKDSRTSRAIMGNIAYPIDIPNEQQNLGELYHLLNCGLEMHFGIGELDFQASREGLSYIPQTIESIKRKLSAVNDVLAEKVAEEANAIENLWDRAQFLIKKGEVSLWRSAVAKYIVDSKFKLVDSSSPNYLRRFEFKHGVEMMAKQFNISILGFTKGPGNGVCSNVKSSTVHVKKGHTVEYKSVWNIPVIERLYFVVNDTKIGATERAKYHWKNGGAPARNERYGSDDYVLVLNPADKSKPMNTKAFFASLRNPPESRIMNASTLKDKPRKTTSGTIAANVTIMSLQQRGYGGYYKEREMVWKDAGKAVDFKQTETYYYLPLSGFEVIHDGVRIDNVKSFYEAVTTSGIPGLANITIYGVRKTDHKWVASQANWINIQTHLKKVLARVDTDLISQFAIKEVDPVRIFQYNNTIEKLVKVDSPFIKFTVKTKDMKDSKVNRSAFERLCREYATAVDIDTISNSVRDEYAAVRARYPLLRGLRDYDIEHVAVADYINMIDSKEVN